MVMLAHVKTLLSQGVILKECGESVLKALVEVVESKGEALYKWISGGGHYFEDVFEALEAYLHEVAGVDAGYMAIGRSRNDHVAAVLRLFIRDRVLEVLQKLIELRRALLDKAIEFRGS
jgi:argininosuccinate lyase